MFNWLKKLILKNEYEKLKEILLDSKNVYIERDELKIKLENLTKPTFSVTGERTIEELSLENSELKEKIARYENEEARAMKSVVIGNPIIGASFEEAKSVLTSQEIEKLKNLKGE